MKQWKVAWRDRSGETLIELLAEEEARARYFALTDQGLDAQLIRVIRSCDL